MKVTVGTKFRYTHADSNPLWEVKSARGRGTWNCEVVESEDWKGTKKVFGSEEILGSIRMAAFWDKSSNDSDNFYRRQPVGTILHYSNGGGAYVRCRVTEDGQLLPFALVGKWASYDLPRRYPNGRIVNGYHVDKIKEGKTFRPHASNVYEFQHQPGAADPATMQPISLELPEMTSEQKTEAEKHERLERLRAIVNNNDMKPDEIFNMAANFLDPNAI